MAPSKFFWARHVTCPLAAFISFVPPPVSNLHAETREGNSKSVTLCSRLLGKGAGCFVFQSTQLPVEPVHPASQPLHEAVVTSSDPGYYPQKMSVQRDACQVCHLQRTCLCSTSLPPPVRSCCLAKDAVIVKAACTAKPRNGPAKGCKKRKHKLHHCGPGQPAGVMKRLLHHPPAAWPIPGGGTSGSSGMWAASRRSQFSRNCSIVSDTWLGPHQQVAGYRQYSVSMCWASWWPLISSTMSNRGLRNYSLSLFRRHTREDNAASAASTTLQENAPQGSSNSSGGQQLNELPGVLKCPAPAGCLASGGWACQAAWCLSSQLHLRSP